MKLYFNQLVTQLKKTLLPCYLISSDVPLLAQEACQQIQQTAKQQGYLERQYIQIEKSFDWANWFSEAHVLSLFNERKIIELHFQDNKPTEIGRKTLEQWAKKPVTDKILVIIIKKLDTALQQSKWVKAIDKTGAIINIYPLDHNQFLQWLSQRLQQVNLQTDSAGLQLLADRTEGNLLAANQAIEKLRLLYPPSKLTLKQIADVIADSARFNIFQLIDYALMGNIKRVIRIIHGLQQEGNEPTLLLWAITRELRNLAVMAFAIKQGQTLPEILQQHQIWEKRKPLVRGVLQRHSYQGLLMLLQQAAMIDRLIKGAMMGNTWEELEKIFLNLSR